jgi:hypothetical protein
MRSVTSTILALGSSLPLAAQHTPRGTAADVSKAEVEATLKKTAKAAVSDQAIRVPRSRGSI